VPHNRPRQRRFDPLILLSALLGVLPAGLWAAPAAAQRAPLVWRWDPGTRIPYTLTERMDQSITDGGKADTDARIEWVREIGFTDEVLSNAAEGAVVRRSFEYVSVQADRAQPGGQPGGQQSGQPAKIQYDTRSPPADPQAARHPMVAPFIALAGRAVEFTVNDEGRVSSITGSEAALDAMHNALLGPLGSGPMHDALAGFSQDASREARLARQFEQAFRLIPGRAVRPGESWDIPIEHVSPLAGSLTSTTTATLKKFDRRRHTAMIDLEGSLSLDADEDTGFAGLVGISLESGAITGSVEFDTVNRVIDRSDMTVRTTWTVGAGLTGGDDPMRQTIEQRATLQRRGAAASSTKP